VNVTCCGATTGEGGLGVKAAVGVAIASPASTSARLPTVTTDVINLRVTHHT
jgi:hypothetical protein